MPQYTLKPFSPPPSPFSVEVNYSQQKSQLKVKFSLKGDISSLNLPPPSKNPDRIDGLYHHTCLEIFLKSGESYLECNFAFSGDWCLFLFEGYRKASSPAGELNKKLFNIDHISRSKEEASLGVSLHLDQMDFWKDSPSHLGLSTVLEHPKRLLSYWALTHVSDKPDFHRSESFIGKL